ncbi:DNA primase [Macleaya cordata]|uniref:DNA-directed primase/polymerase protein n=1 Tax=Macleaya cordata TaxID=56857 RepID=A0A200PVB4_MACCD|nr:DNA primase [Macleaya cordata]
MESAIRERKKSQNKFSNASLSQGEASASLRQQNSADRQLCMEKQLGTTEINPIKFKSRKRISPVVFYGSPHGVPAKRPKRLLQLLHEIHNDLSEENDFNSRKQVWATFPKQDQAIAFAKSHSHVHLFSYQDRLNGQRRFLVSTYEEFWRRYKNMDSTFRHHYEVIQEGLPCHLYFDLEFNKRANADKNGEEMVDLLISVTLDALFDKYSIQGNQDWIVELDSSTEEKFSRHLIIRIPETAFKDNSHTGAFVAEICSRISSARESDPRLDKLFVLKDSCSAEFPPQLFVDNAVYSRNRCFRVALSSKAGKRSVLLPTGRFKCKNMREEEMFMESLICKIDGDCQKLLICKLDSECMKTLCFNSEVLNSNCEEHFSAPDVLALHACSNDLPTTYFMGKSPFPALDIFVESIASTGNVSGGKIRSWYWFSDYGVMVYSMSRNRYCERIGREHKSNHVMYIVDFKRAVYYQKCYDPDCKGYRSPIRPIPMDVIPDNVAFMHPSQAENYRSMNNNLDHQFDNNDAQQLHNSCGKDQRSCGKNGWWLEAMRIADEIESMRKAQEHDELPPQFYDVFTLQFISTATKYIRTGCRK